jgi:Dyp-type peroxidase family
MTGPAAPAVELDNLQGFVVKPYGRRLSRYAFYGFPQESNPRGFLKALLPRITTARDGDSIPKVCLNVALTHSGLERLEGARGVLGKMDPALAEGPDPIALGDVPGSASDPSHWWEGQFGTGEIHSLVLVQADEEADFRGATDSLASLARDCGAKELLPRRDGTRLDGKAMPGGVVHFGYRDGISQPSVNWKGTPSATELHFRHFLLGYSTPEVSSSPLSEPAAGYLRDSSYLVLRWMYQDSAAFNRFLRDQSRILAPNLPPHEAQELLAAKLVGRWRNGTPLVLSPASNSPPLAADNGFDYRVQDPSGLKCPFSAHIRVCNPRNQPLDPVADVEGVPRIIRRGAPYGDPFPSDRFEDDGVDRGLIGVFVCSSILRQFYTLTRWIRENSFSPVYDQDRHAQDPLFGNRRYPGASSQFLVPGASGTTSIRGLVDFVRTKGTAFFLLPSIRALTLLAH